MEAMIEEQLEIVYDSCLQQARESHPSDYIHITRKEDLFLSDLWECGTRNNISIPSDIIFAKTVPLMDCNIVVDETDEGGYVVDYRVVIFDSYKMMVDYAMKSHHDGGFLIGALVMKPVTGFDQVKRVTLPICAQVGIDSLGTSLYIAEKHYHISTKLMNGLFVSCLETWYGIQIAMLHPAVKDVFLRPKIVPESGVKAESSRKRKRKTRYVKKHIIRLEDLESISHSKEERKINRKCLAWYVIGHWRQYRNGKKVFIQPYWKGALREMRRNASGDDRERIVANPTQ